MTPLPLPGRTRFATYGQVLGVSVGLFVLGILLALLIGEEPSVMRQPTGNPTPVTAAP